MSHCWQRWVLILYFSFQSHSSLLETESIPLLEGLLLSWIREHPPPTRLSDKALNSPGTLFSEKLPSCWLGATTETATGLGNHFGKSQRDSRKRASRKEDLICKALGWVLLYLLCPTFGTCTCARISLWHTCTFLQKAPFQGKCSVNFQVRKLQFQLPSLSQTALKCLCSSSC